MSDWDNIRVHDIENAEEKRQQIRDWLAELEYGERVRIIQFFCNQFGVEIPEGMVLAKPTPDGEKVIPPNAVKMNKVAAQSAGG